MSREEKQICYDIMVEGHIVRIQKSTCEMGNLVCCLCVYGGRFYSITTLNDEYIYFFHHNTTDGLEKDVEYCKHANIPLNYKER